MKPVLKAPGTKRLKLTCDKLLSNVAFSLNLRRYTEDALITVLHAPPEEEDVRHVPPRAPAPHEHPRVFQDAHAL
jgi:hypothetical protein